MTETDTLDDLLNGMDKEVLNEIEEAEKLAKESTEEPDESPAEADPVVPEEIDVQQPDNEPQDQDPADQDQKTEEEGASKDTPTVKKRRIITADDLNKQGDEKKNFRDY